MFSFQFQYEQTAKCGSCTDNAGARSRKSDTAALQDKLTGALIGLARATDGNEHLISASSTAVIVESLCATLANTNYDNDALQCLLHKVEEEKRKMVPNCFSCAAPCGRTSAYDMDKLWSADEDIRSLKSLILLGIRGLAAYAYHAAVLGYHDDTVDRFLYKALIVIGMDDFGMGELLPIVMEMGEVHLTCMALPDKVSTETLSSAPITSPEDDPKAIPG